MTRSAFPYVLALVLSAVAVAGVDVEIDPNVKASGTLTAGAERDAFRFFGTRGADLVLTLKAKKKADVDFDLTLQAPDFSFVDLSAARKFKDKGKAILVKGLELPQTGEYVLGVGAAGAGDYSLRLQAKPTRRIVETYDLGPGEDAVIAFATPAGSDVKVTATARGGGDPQLAAEPPAKATVNRLTLADTDAGEHGVRVTNAGSQDSVQVVVTVRPPKSRPEKLDVRAAALGDPDGGGTAKSATVAAATGGDVTVDDAFGPLLGAGVSVPAGALSVDVRISVASALPVDVPDPQTQTSAGPAVHFGPDGLSFSTDASVTVPFDPSLIPVGANAADVLRVVRVMADGTVLVLVPISIDLGAGLVTVPTSGFSTFMAFVPQGTPRIDDRSFWMLGMRLHMKPDDQQGGNSTRRDLDMRVGSVDFDSLGNFYAFADDIGRSVDHDAGGVAQTFANFTPGTFESGTFTYDASGQGVTLDDGQSPPHSLALSADGRALLGTNDASVDPSAELTLLLRRGTGEVSPTSATLPAGTYTYVAFSLRADAPQGGPGGPAFLSREHELGTLTVRADGSVSLAADGFAEDFDPSGGTPSQHVGSFTGTGTLAFDPAPPSGLYGSLVLTADDDNGKRLRILPSERGNILIGLSDVTDTQSATDAPFMVFVAVRRGRGLSEASMVGAHLFASVRSQGLDTYQPMSPGAPVVGDFTFESESTQVAFDGTRHVTVGPGASRSVHRDPAEPSGTGVSGTLEFDSSTFQAEIRLTSDGQFRTVGEDPNFKGGVTPNALFGVATDDPRGTSPGSGFSFFIRLPPGGGLVLTEQ